MRPAPPGPRLITPETAAPTKRARRRAAVMVVHGMGQQVPYETLAQVADAVGERTGARDTMAVRPDRLAGRELRRAELAVDDVDVHLYEGYWAPITQGRVTARDVLRFLGAGAWQGITNAWGGFTRYRFGQSRTERPRVTTLLALLVASGVLASLVVMNLLALAVGGAAATAPAWLPPHVLSDITWLIGIFAASLVLTWTWTKVAAAARRLARVIHRARGATTDAPGAPAALTWPAWAAIGLTTAAAIGSAATALYLIGAELLLPSTQGGLGLTPLPTWVVAPAWAALLVVSILARGVFVSFVGDVAAYVSPHKLDKFADIRRQIKKTVCDDARALYAAKDADGAPYYDGVIIVGHSLGSVVAYDTLNTLLAEDATAPKEARVDVAARTPLLLTFGSPLDKTAFVFATSAKKGSATREALASLGQPLIQAAEYRRVRWVNVHASADIISGRLDLYDDPAGNAPAVDNRPDPAATTPLLAHNEFWENDLVWRVLREEGLRRTARTLDVQVPAQQKKEKETPAPRQEARAGE